ncbi:MAG: hypothetical protein OXH76_09020 [Boseongicola sp.]|nr:hypothetical protein [Boseongicola sp.]
MHDGRKQHGLDMIGDPSRMLELGDTCVRNCLAWLIGKTMCGGIKAVPGCEAFVPIFLDLAETPEFAKSGGADHVAGF